MTIARDKYFTDKGSPKIYAFTTPHHKETVWKGVKDKKGLLKIGYTQGDVEKRVRQQFPTTMPEKRPFEIVHSEPAVTDDNRFFKDNIVHKELEKKGFRRVGGEWFECTVEDLKQVLIEIKTGQKFSSQGRHESFAMRPEQQRAVEVTASYFQECGAKKANHFLWNAKMRFGKTFAAYQLAKKMGWTRILVLTYKPAVAGAWHEDLMSHKDFDGWQFIGRDDRYEDMDESRPIVWFASFQDILGRTQEGEDKPKFGAAREIDWDCVILDEYHFGAWRDTAKKLYGAEEEEEISSYEEFAKKTLPLSIRHYLYLSGTPFRALASGEFLDDQIFNWTYADEQRAKESWNEKRGGENPYLELPQLVLMTYQMPDALRDIAIHKEQNEFDLGAFFKAKQIEEEEQGFKFVHEDAVQGWLHLIRGRYLSDKSQAGAFSEKPPVPFEDVWLQRHLVHTLWFLPSVAACKAMAQLLAQRQNSFFHDYEIIVAAGTEAGTGQEAVKPVRNAIGGGIGTKTITLSCGKLTTGVSIEPWSGIFMLRNTSSPETYFQAAFRVQTPWCLRNHDGLDPHKKEVLKHKCYVFDFAPSRALNLIADYSRRIALKQTEGTIEDHIEDFLNFLPVLCYDDFSMQPLNASELLDISVSGVASTMLAKRWQSSRMVRVDAITLEELLKKEGLVEALQKIEAFRNLGKDLKRVISSEKALNQTKREKKKLTKKEKEKEREDQAFKRKLQEKLIQFVTRIPVFMYLTDYREDKLRDVINNIEPKLFTQVTGLEVKDFQTLCDIGVFNDELMDDTIFAFKRFEEASLVYAGGKELPELIGGFSTVISRAEFDETSE